MKPSFSESDIRDVSLLPGVKGVMSLGSVLAVELKTAEISVLSSYQRPPIEFTEQDNKNENENKNENKNEFGMELGSKSYEDSIDSQNNIKNDFKNEFYQSTTATTDLSSGNTSTSNTTSNSTSSLLSAQSQSVPFNPKNSNSNSRYYNTNASAVVVSLLKQNNVYARPLGNVVYLMPTPMTPIEDRQRLIRVIKR